MILFTEINLLTESLSTLFNPESLIRNGGLLIIFLFVFAQTGLFFCFFLPGGSVLFTTGVVAATGALDHSIATICVTLVLASFSGTIVGYWFGRKTGPLLYKRKDSAFFRQQHMVMAEAFYKKYGVLALTAGLFFPIIRTFAPIVAGMIKVNFGRFLLLTFSGSVLWILAMVLPGYFMASIPLLKGYLTYIVIALILVVTIPAALRMVREFRILKKEADEMNRPKQ